MKLNLGCGDNKLESYVNADVIGEPDVKHDLESFPWPWEDNSANEILCRHVLEHVGRDFDVFVRVIQELYRVGKDGASVVIIVPPPSHDDFYSDPTHVRAVTQDTMALFSLAKNREAIENNFGDSRLAIKHKVNFDVVEVQGIIDDWFWAFAKKHNLDDEDIKFYAKGFRNAYKEFRIFLKVNKKERLE